MNHSKSRYSKFQKRIFFTVSCLFILGFVWKIQYCQNNNGLALSLYPNGKNFAFTITDDPDGNTLEKIKPVYDYLRQTSIKTTAAVWVFKGQRSNGIPDVPRNSWSVDTCEREDYLAYMKQLWKEGFEIALHGVSCGNDRREITIRGYEKFRDYFGTYPKMNIMHAQNLENVYWGKKVVSNKIAQFLIGLFINRSDMPFSGEDSSSKYFWGDILKQKTKYVRLFGTSDINTLRFNPSMPYNDPEKPAVNFWFSFSDGSSVDRFVKMLSKENIEKLMKERGACIVYTHFARNFVKNGELDEDFKKGIDRLVSQPDGWFVPTSVLLDRLLLMKRVFLTTAKNGVMIVNHNDVAVNGVTLMVKPQELYFGINGDAYHANEEGEIIIGTLKSKDGIVLFKEKDFVVEDTKNTAIKTFGIKVIDFKDAIYISSHSSSKTVELIQTITKDHTLYDLRGNEIMSNVKWGGLLSDSDTRPHFILVKKRSVLCPIRKYPTPWESFNMIFQRAILYFKHNNGYKAFST